MERAQARSACLCLLKAGKSELRDTSFSIAGRRCRWRTGIPTHASFEATNAGPGTSSVVRNFEKCGSRQEPIVEQNVSHIKRYARQQSRSDSKLWGWTTSRSPNTRYCEVVKKGLVPYCLLAMSRYIGGKYTALAHLRDCRLRMPY
jgi:hypothetical protein